jgi:uncharacterized Zn finger protein
VETLEKVPCGDCGNGELEVKSSHYGQWRVDEVLVNCAACGSDDILKAREEQKKSAQK